MAQVKLKTEVRERFEAALERGDTQAAMAMLDDYMAESYENINALGNALYILELEEMKVLKENSSD